MVPPVVCVVGKSGVGKTYVMERLIAEMKRRGYRVATAKHSRHGFVLDQEGKDTWKHAQAGSDAVLISASDKVAVIKTVDHDHTLAELSRFIGPDYDIVLAEGFKQDKAPKVEVHRKQFGKDLLSSEEELVAIATDEPLEATAPQFSPDDARGIADVIEKRFLRREDGDTVTLFVNGKVVPLSPFPRSFIARTLLGMVTALKNVPEPVAIDISVRKKVEK